MRRGLTIKTSGGTGLSLGNSSSIGVSSVPLNLNQPLSALLQQQTHQIQLNPHLLSADQRGQLITAKAPQNQTKPLTSPSQPSIIAQSTTSLIDPSSPTPSHTLLGSTNNNNNNNNDHPNQNQNQNQNETFSTDLSASAKLSNLISINVLNNPPEWYERFYSQHSTQSLVKIPYQHFVPFLYYVREQSANPSMSDIFLTIFADSKPTMADDEEEFNEGKTSFKPALIDMSITTSTQYLRYKRFYQIIQHLCARLLPLPQVSAYLLLHHYYTKLYSKASGSDWNQPNQNMFRGQQQPHPSSMSNDDLAKELFTTFELDLLQYLPSFTSRLQSIQNTKHYHDLILAINSLTHTQRTKRPPPQITPSAAHTQSNAISQSLISMYSKTLINSSKLHSQSGWEYRQFTQHYQKTISSAIYQFYLSSQPYFNTTTSPLSAFSSHATTQANFINNLLQSTPSMFNAYHPFLALLQNQHQYHFSNYSNHHRPQEHKLDFHSFSSFDSFASNNYTHDSQNNGQYTTPTPNTTSTSNNHQITHKPHRKQQETSLIHQLPYSCDALTLLPHLPHSQTFYLNLSTDTLGVDNNGVNKRLYINTYFSTYTGSSPLLYQQIAQSHSLHHNQDVINLPQIAQAAKLRLLESYLAQFSHFSALLTTSHHFTQFQASFATHCLRQYHLPWHSTLSPPQQSALTSLLFPSIQLSPIHLSFHGFGNKHPIILHFFNTALRNKHSILFDAYQLLSLDASSIKALSASPTPSHISSLTPSRTIPANYVHNRQSEHTSVFLGAILHFLMGISNSPCIQSVRILEHPPQPINSAPIQLFPPHTISSTSFAKQKIYRKSTSMPGQEPNSPVNLPESFDRFQQHLNRSARHAQPLYQSLGVITPQDVDSLVQLQTSFSKQPIRKSRQKPQGEPRIIRDLKEANEVLDKHIDFMALNFGTSDQHQSTVPDSIDLSSQLFNTDCQSKHNEHLAQLQFRSQLHPDLARTRQTITKFLIARTPLPLSQPRKWAFFSPNYFPSLPLYKWPQFTSPRYPKSAQCQSSSRATSLLSNMSPYQQLTSGWFVPLQTQLFTKTPTSTPASEFHFQSPEDQRLQQNGAFKMTPEVAGLMYEKAITDATYQINDILSTLSRTNIQSTIARNDPLAHHEQYELPQTYHGLLDGFEFDVDLDTFQEELNHHIYINSVHPTLLRSQQQQQQQQGESQEIPLHYINHDNWQVLFRTLNKNEYTPSYLPSNTSESTHQHKVFSGSKTNPYKTASKPSHKHLLTKLSRPQQSPITSLPVSGPTSFADSLAKRPVCISSSANRQVALLLQSFEAHRSIPGPTTVTPNSAAILPSTYTLPRRSRYFLMAILEQLAILRGKHIEQQLVQNKHLSTFQLYLGIQSLDYALRKNRIFAAVLSILMTFSGLSLVSTTDSVDASFQLQQLNLNSPNQHSLFDVNVPTYLPYPQTTNEHLTTDKSLTSKSGTKLDKTAQAAVTTPATTQAVQSTKSKYPIWEIHATRTCPPLKHILASLSQTQNKMFFLLAQCQVNFVSQYRKWHDSRGARNQDRIRHPIDWELNIAETEAKDYFGKFPGLVDTDWFNLCKYSLIVRDMDNFNVQLRELIEQGVVIKLTTTFQNDFALRLKTYSGSFYTIPLSLEALQQAIVKYTKSDE